LDIFQRKFYEKSSDRPHLNIFEKIISVTAVVCRVACVVQVKATGEPFFQGTRQQCRPAVDKWGPHAVTSSPSLIFGQYISFGGRKIM